MRFLHTVRNSRVFAFLLYAGSIVYCCLLFYLVFFSRRRRGNTHFRDQVNLRPFKKIIQFFSDNGFDFSKVHYPFWEDFLGNIVLFLPFPLALSVLLGKFKARQLLGLTLATSVGIELCQYVFAVGNMDVDDIILNTAGGCIGIMLRFFWMKWLPAGSKGNEQV